MQKLGYGADNRLAVKVSARDLPFLRDPAVLLIDQLKEVYIDGTLETIDTAGCNTDLCFDRSSNLSARAAFRCPQRE